MTIHSPQTAGNCIRFSYVLTRTLPGWALLRKGLIFSAGRGFVVPLLT